MNDQPVWEKPAACVVRFKSSSSKDGRDGYELAVASDATTDAVTRTVALAAHARRLVEAELAGTLVLDAVRALGEPAEYVACHVYGDADDVQDKATSIEPDAFDRARPAEATPFA